MGLNLAYIQDFLSHYPYSKEAVDFYTNTVKKINENEAFADEIMLLAKDYMAETLPMYKVIMALEATAEKYNFNVFVLDGIFVLAASEILLEHYLKKGYPAQLFYDTMTDFYCKTYECIKNRGVFGTFVLSWYEVIFKMSAIALGRFIYEKIPFDEDFVTKSGYVIKKDRPVYSFHIPSSGVSLTDQVRFDSYKRAYDFFKEELSDGVLVLHCSSWLLNPDHEEMLPADSNIVKFGKDFEIYNVSYLEDSWRIFGASSMEPVENWPEDSSLQKAYKTWLLNGNKIKYAKGVIVFDGEKIVR